MQSNSDPRLASLVRVITAVEISEETNRIFVSLVSEAVKKLQDGKLTDHVIDDYIFVLKCGLSILEGRDKLQMMRAIKMFESAQRSELGNGVERRFSR